MTRGKLAATVATSTMSRPAARVGVSAARGSRRRGYAMVSEARRRPRLPRALLVLLAVVVGLPVALVVATGFVLDTPQPAPQPSDAIIVISGDEQLARFREGMRLFQAGMGRYLVFSGAARDNGISNADVMHDLAIEAGVPQAAIVEDPLGEDTWGNAVYTRGLLEQRGAKSAILVTSPYHARRAIMTFDAAYTGSGISLVVHSAPDSEWRKLSWWKDPDTRRLTFSELQKLAYITATGQYH
jgi:uncharacterized SAM-binding protein YcdF (DUF218 family)